MYLVLPGQFFRCLGHAASAPTVMISRTRTTTADTSDTEAALMMTTSTMVAHAAPARAAGGIHVFLFYDALWGVLTAGR